MGMGTTWRACSAVLMPGTGRHPFDMTYLQSTGVKCEWMLVLVAFYAFSGSPQGNLGLGSIIGLVSNRRHYVEHVAKCVEVVGAIASYSTTRLARISSRRQSACKRARCNRHYAKLKACFQRSCATRSKQVCSRNEFAVTGTNNAN